jgi:hypothetical protein
MCRPLCLCLCCVVLCCVVLCCVVLCCVGSGLCDGLITRAENPVGFVCLSNRL